MNPLLHIRKNVLGVTQAQLAEVVGSRQATVSRWEKGQLEPSRTDLARIRRFAAERGVEWNDGWFFEAPEQSEAAA